MNTNDAAIKYCVTAIVDLQGFSSHLEIGNDLRTTIGNEALERLGILEEAEKIVRKQALLAEKNCLPPTFHMQRINDSLILMMDLPDMYRPRIGETVQVGITPTQMSDESSSTSPLMRFVGLVARIHTHIDLKESEKHFAGAKTVIATGYRKTFVDSENRIDYLSANFSLSNAYLAHNQLKGANLFCDNNILQMLSYFHASRNVLRHAVFVRQQYQYNPLLPLTNEITIPNPKVFRDPISITLFKKSYFFRQLDPAPLAFLQLLPDLLEHLEDLAYIESSPVKNKTWYRVLEDLLKVKSEDALSNSSRIGISTIRIDLDAENEIEYVKDCLVELIQDIKNPSE